MVVCKNLLNHCVERWFDASRQNHINKDEPIIIAETKYIDFAMTNDGLT